MTAYLIIELIWRHMDLSGPSEVPDIASISIKAHFDKEMKKLPKWIILKMGAGDEIVGPAGCFGTFFAVWL
jgi:hypothetical protein